MPRQARTISATNVYHAILRGVNKQQMFEDEEKAEFDNSSNVLSVFPNDYFSPIETNRRRFVLKTTNNTYSIHHFANSLDGWGTEKVSSLTFAGTQSGNMSDEGAKEQQQGGFFGFCQPTPSQTKFKPTSNLLKPHQTKFKPSLEPHQTPSNPKIISQFNCYSEYFL